MRIKDSFAAERVDSFLFQESIAKPLLALLAYALLMLGLMAWAADADAGSRSGTRKFSPVPEPTTTTTTTTADSSADWTVVDEVVYVLSAGTVTPQGSRSGTRKL